MTPAASEPRARLPARTLVAFGLGSLGTGIFSTTPGVLLLFFMTSTLGVSPALAGLAVFLPKIWDVISDPLMGYLSDRTRSRWGRRRPYLLVGAIAMALTYVFLFNVPDLASPLHSFWYVMVLFALSATAYTVFAIPYVAMPAEMSDDSAERVRILSYRMTFAMAGAIVGSALAPWLVQAFGGGRVGYATMSYVIGGICAGAMLIAFLASRSIPLRETAISRGFLWRQVADTLQSPRYRSLASVYIVQILAVGALVAAVPYFATYVLGADEGKVGTMLLVMMGSATLTIPLWGMLARQFGKYRCLLCGVTLLASGSAALWWLEPGDDTMLHVLMGVLGIGFGAQQVLPFAMLTDVIQADAAAEGRIGREGITTGVWVAGEKLGLALGPLVTAWVLAATGFQAGVDASQTPMAITGIQLALSAVPATLFLLSGTLLWRVRRPWRHPVTERPA